MQIISNRVKRKRAPSVVMTSKDRSGMQKSANLSAVLQKAGVRYLLNVFLVLCSRFAACP